MRVCVLFISCVQQRVKRCNRIHLYDTVLMGRPQPPLSPVQRSPAARGWVGLHVHVYQPRCHGATVTCLRVQLVPRTPAQVWGVTGRYCSIVPVQLHIAHALRRQVSQLSSTAPRANRAPHGIGFVELRDTAWRHEHSLRRLVLEMKSVAAERHFCLVSGCRKTSLLS